MNHDQCEIPIRSVRGLQLIGGNLLSMVVFKNRGRGTLYPTIALSDSWMVATHLLAARNCHSAGAHEPAVGALIVVAITAACGVLRFGFHERLFAPWNRFLADFSAFVVAT